MRSVVEIGASVPAFLGKLWKLVNDTETNHLISWSPGGKTFVIKNQADFARELLPLYYKHNNMASFIRQLNMYGFHKITSVENGGLRYEKDEIEFSHPCFMRGNAYLLEHIKRKIANSKSIVSSDSGDKILLKPELMNKVLADVKQMKGKQETLDAKFSAMKQENEALWREVAILRQKHIKQQQIVNNLIQFLMSLVQPTRPPNANGNNVGVKRPYQLMINNAAHNLACADSSYPGKIKNIKLNKESSKLELEDINEDNLQDGPTIHELAHDDILHSEASQESLDPANFVTMDAPDLDADLQDAQSSVDPVTDHQYLVVMDDEDDARHNANKTAQSYPSSKQTIKRLPTSSPIPTVTVPGSPENFNDLLLFPGISRPKNKTNKTFASSSGKTFLSPSDYNVLNPSADLKLPAEIFASDDSVSDAGVGTTDDIMIEGIVQEPNIDASCASPKDKMLGGINIKLEKPSATSVAKPVSKKTKKVTKDNVDTLDLATIKTELQDDIDWNTMTLATVNNNSNINRVQTRNNRRDHIGKSREDLASLFGTNPNKTDIDDQLECMQTDLESLKELLRSDSYSLDTNTLLGLFGTDDPFYGLSYNLDDRTKQDSNVEGNQLISYTGNIPDFEDIEMPELEGDNSQDVCVSPTACSSTLNTPQAEVPNWKIKP